MSKVISFFNNKGGVGKTTLTWNTAQALADKGKNVLLIDFDPQCNLSLAMIGENNFSEILNARERGDSKTIHAYLSPTMLGVGDGKTFPVKGKYTNSKVTMIPGDFWLNSYADWLSLGDLLAGTGVARFVELRQLIAKTETQEGMEYDFILIDIPPSFGTIVRSALYSSDYFIIPCTSDTFSAYCVSLIGEVLPSFFTDWKQGVQRFPDETQRNIFSQYGQPKFAGWVFNGFDQIKKEPILTDRKHRTNIEEAIQNNIVNNAAIMKADKVVDWQIGAIEDMNVLVNESIWQSVPISKLSNFKPAQTREARRAWAPNQIDQMRYLSTEFDKIAGNIITNCK